MIVLAWMAVVVALWSLADAVVAGMRPNRGHDAAIYVRAFVIATIVACALFILVGGE